MLLRWPDSLPANIYFFHNEKKYNTLIRFTSLLMHLLKLLNCTSRSIFGSSITIRDTVPEFTGLMLNVAVCDWGYIVSSLDVCKRRYKTFDRSWLSISIYLCKNKIVKWLDEPQPHPTCHIQLGPAASEASGQQFKGKLKGFTSQFFFFFCGEVFTRHFLFLLPVTNIEVLR